MLKNLEVKYKYFTSVNRPKTVGQAFSPIEATYHQVEVGGNKRVVMNDKKDWRNTFDIVQANAVGSDIYDIINRHLNGDPNTGIGMVNWEDGDFTGVTSSYIDMQAKLNRAKSIFDGLDINVKRQFGFDFETFLRAVDNGSFADQARNAKSGDSNVSEKTSADNKSAETAE